MNIVTTLAQSVQHYDSISRYNGSTLTPEQVATLVMIVTFVIFATLILSTLMYVVMSVCLMSIFKKAGIQQWIAWVPFYNSWKLLEIGGQQGFWAVLNIVPVINIASAVFMYIAMYNIGLKLGKSGSFVLLAIFLPIVWLIWLAIDKTPWNDAAGAPSLAGYPEPPEHPHHNTPHTTTH